MTTALHRELEPTEIHGGYRKIFADAAARTGDPGPYTAVDVANGLKSLQLDTMVEYHLTDDSPITWTAVERLPRLTFYGADLDDPNSASWTVNALATLGADTVTTALPVRRFDDTTEEGVGFSVLSPVGATNLRLKIVSRAQTAPGGAVTVRPALYVREFPDNAAPEAWSAATLLTAIDIPTNTNWQYDTQTIALATLGMVAGRFAQFELTRKGTDGSDTLTGDWTVLAVGVEFT